MRTRFPTRQVLANSAIAAAIAERARARAGAIGAEATAEPLLFSFVLGEDPKPREMARAEIEALGDVFTQRLILRGAQPMTVRELVDTIAALEGGDALRSRQMFLVAEGGQFQASHPNFAPNARLVFSWRADDSSPPDLLLSTVPAADDPQALMQVIAWSPKDEAFHFFERKQAWAWAGNSFHALVSPTRGLGPFDSHVNGGLVMKELKRPWAHWHSQSSGIPRDFLGAQSEFATEPLFAQLAGAEQLEGIVISGVRRWTKGRFKRDFAGGEVRRLRTYLRQVLWCTSLNLVSATKLFDDATAAAFDLPISLFIDSDGLDMAARALDPGAGLIPQRAVAADAAIYRRAAAKLALHVIDDARPPTRREGDTHFAFLVPERAFEDQAVLSLLLAREVLSPRLALCLLLVDFSNPVFSPRRASLLAHAPDVIKAGAKGAALDQAFIDALSQTAAPGSAEGELLALWQSEDLLGAAAQKINALVEAVEAKARTEDGITELMKLADSRRTAYRERSLDEFEATTARLAASAPHLAMAPDGAVFSKNTDVGEGEL